MKLYQLILLSVLSFGLTSIAVASEDSLRQKLSSFVEDGSFSGVLSFKCDDGKLETYAFGECDRENKTLCTAETKFRIGSVSKNFTAAAILSLTESENLKLEDSVSKWIPEYNPENLILNEVPVTIHHLLSHTSGLPLYEGTQHLKDNIWRRPITVLEMIEAVHAQPLKTVPGVHYEYSNLGFRLLSLIVERASQNNFSAQLNLLLQKASMENTGAALPNQEGLAKGYFIYNDKWFSLYDSGDFFADRDLITFTGSGSLYSSVSDLIKWMDALREGKILSKESFSLMLKPNLENYGYAWTQMYMGDTLLAWHNGALSPLGFYSEAGFDANKKFAYSLLLNVNMTSVKKEALKTVHDYMAQQCSL